MELLAPVGDLRLVATEVQPLEEQSASLLPDTVRQGETLALVLERIAARLGPQRVLRPVLVRRPPPGMDEPLAAARAEPLPRKRGARHRHAATRPSCCREPLRLAMRGTGRSTRASCSCSPARSASRAAGGTASGDGEAATRATWCATTGWRFGEQAGVLWIFQTRLDDATAWYLHGHRLRERLP